MFGDLVWYSVVFLLGVFISSVSQVLLKKSAMRTYESPIKEYCNPLVIGAYTIFVLATVATIIAYKVVPLSFGPILEATSYIYVTLFGVFIFKEKMSARKVGALCLIVSGIVVYSLSI
ncbi:multidrug ABC transporter [Gordonibacter urolithinfaciens]|uniref:multidrug ABC transporter n=1 Tax=Gordonibacter urolithinfaciens TaxID=1335613 RepID=UPI000F4CF7C1|nr:multidrug ABC transporter [Gordonibacter urolithinfaciens]ROT88287.1 multidrug ABC transporter [Gordonibacter urolithinfaciens]